MTDGQALALGLVIWLVVPLALLWVARRRKKRTPYDPNRFWHG